MNVPVGGDAFWLRLIQREMDRQINQLGENLARYMFAPADGLALTATPYAITPVIAKCECGSGCDEPSGAHSHWCRCWVAP